MKKLLLCGILATSSVGFSNNITLDLGNFIALTSGVNPTSMGNLAMDLMRSEAKELIVYIDSPGGSVFALNSFKDIARASGKKLVCYADFAASAAFTLMQICDERVAGVSGSVLMQHYGSYGLGSQPQNLQKSTIAMLDTVMDEFVENERTRIGNYSKEEYENIIRNDWWSTGRLALERNIVDKLVGITCSYKLVKETKVEVFNTFFGEVHVTFSACPLIKAPLAIAFAEYTPVEAQKEFLQQHNSAIYRNWAVTNIK
jgi:ATP-dependent protease ClpP protease subunit